MKGILLANLGTPDSTSVKDVRKYLDEFLMDERTMDLPWIPRALLVKGVILRRRPKHTAAAYKKVWTEQGSPLLLISRKVQEKLQNIVDVPVSLGMRYGNPSVESAMEELVRKGVKEIIFVALYPQYAMSTTETAVVMAEEVRKKRFPDVKLRHVKAFYNRDVYITALANKIKKHLPENFDKLQFSYHGLPERHIFKTDRTHTCNLENCRSDGPHHFNEYCYLNHCMETTRLVTEKLGLPNEKVVTSFQSRLLNDPWLRPYTDETFEKLGKGGVKNLAVACPAFVSDCLETYEEIGMEGKETFLKAGGENFTYLPCLNDEDEWIEVLKTLCEELM